MEKVLFIVAASVLCADSSGPEREYSYISEQKNWAEARSYCREKHKDLAVIHNMEDVKILNNRNANKNRAWIGLYNNVSKWTWSMADTDFYKHEAGFTNWAPGDPNYTNGKTQCGLIHYHGYWYDAPCGWLLKSVCSDVKGSEVSFVLINQTMTWTEAQSFCREHHTDLASVRNLEENQEILQLIPADTPVWIGLFRHSWKWVDGRNLSFSYWGATDSDGAMDDCVATNFKDSGKWENWNCDQTKQFICYDEIFSKQVVRLSLVRNSSVDLNDPAVLKDLLQKFRQKLKDQGVDGDVQLTWRKQSDGKIFHKEKEEEEQKSTSEKDEI